MLEVSDLPHFIAGFNAASVVCLFVGYVFIRRRDIDRHRLAMFGALVCSAGFLVVYVRYKANSGFARFGGEGVVRPIYFTILTVHVLGAIAITPLAPMLVWRAFTGRFPAHKRLARIVWPLWMFVGISGDVVYVMAVHLYPYAHV